MLYKLKENLPTIEILLGCAVFLYFILCSTISLAILWAIFIIYVWLFTAIALGKYTFKAFVDLICCSGAIISVALFFIYGIEELPYPEGALMFHVEGIVKALILFFVSTVPLILIHKNIKYFPQQNIKNQSNKNKTTPENKTYSKEKWEEATIEDIESGNFEAI